MTFERKTWLCEECKPKLLRKSNTVEDRIESFAARLEAVLNFMENKLEEKIRQEIRFSLPKELEKLLPRPTVVRREKSEPTATDTIESNTGEGSSHTRVQVTYPQEKTSQRTVAHGHQRRARDRI